MEHHHVRGLNLTRRLRNVQETALHPTAQARALQKLRRLGLIAGRELQG
jgi:hypothetical protein